MRLSDIFKLPPGTKDIVITGLCEDTRQLKSSDIFFAHQGSRDNGLNHVATAIKNGAAAIVAPNGANVSTDLPVIHVENTRLALARAAQVLYPNTPATLLAVTGTSGKTSTTYFVQELLNQLDTRAVCVGTMGVCGAVTRAGNLTTPTAPELHRTLHELAAEGVAVAALETSSQGIAQYRVDALKFRAAAFTNLSREHLDYHASMDEYHAAKSRLFIDLLRPDAPAVLNIDDEWVQKTHAVLVARGHPVITVGRDSSADMRLIAHDVTPHHQHIAFTFGHATHDFTTHIAGDFQAMNILTAIALCTTTGAHIDDLVAVAAQIGAPPGRMEPVLGHPAGAAVYIDYAHKPDALENILAAARRQNPHRLIIVFGCGGDRDAGKRPVMGEIAHRLADTVIITDDNPRTEKPAAIRATIMAACPGAIDIADRRQAIRTAITQAGANDIVIIAGKGHEEGQKFKDHSDPFSDLAEAKAAIAALSPTSRKERSS